MKAAVLGSPVAHSLSPALHAAAYRHLGLSEWSYEAHDVTAARLAGFLAGLGPDWAGLSLTMPLKQAVLPLLDEVDPLAAQVGAANTVVLGGGARWGGNTDVPGMVAALREVGVDAVGQVVLLGGGATARSALAAASQLGATGLDAYLRDPARGGQALVTLAADLGVPVRLRSWTEVDPAAEPLRSADLVVATTPAGSTDALAAALAGVRTDAHTPPGVLFDVVYAPWPTPLAAAWQAAGGRTVGGLDLLVHQAALQVPLMLAGRPGVPEVDPAELVPVMRAAGEAALAARR